MFLANLEHRAKNQIPPLQQTLLVTKSQVMVKKIFFFFLLQWSLVAAFAQPAATHPKLKGWHLLNYQQDGYYGTGVKEAYQLLAGRKAPRL